jgi:hypothetical protein
MINQWHHGQPNITSNCQFYQIFYSILENNYIKAYHYSSNDKTFVNALPRKDYFVELINWIWKQFIILQKKIWSYLKYLSGKRSTIIVHWWKCRGMRSTQSTLSSSTLKKPASFRIFIKFPSSTFIWNSRGKRSTQSTIISKDIIWCNLRS